MKRLPSAPLIAFLAGHLLSPEIASGGDVLFCELAARIRARQPDWRIVALAPQFAEAALSRYFESVVTLRPVTGEGRQGSAVSTAITWFRRLGAVREALDGLRPDLIHATGDFFVDTFPSSRAQAQLGAKWSGVVHHINAAPFQRRNALLVSASSYVLQRRSLARLRTADSISVLNEAVGTELVRLGFDPGRVHIVGAGIDISRFPLLPGGGTRRRRILWINRLEPTKGIFDLPAILARLPHDVVLDVVGRGPAEQVEKLQQSVSKAGVAERCVMHGFVPATQLSELLSAADIFVSCSYEEGWGISIAEALSAGLACVAYDLPSHRELFGDAIVRVPLGDTRAFAAAVTALLDVPDSQEQRRARHALAATHSLDASAERQERIFAGLLNVAPNDPATAKKSV